MLMPKWHELYDKWNGLVHNHLDSLGLWGIALISIVDASSLPVPMDFAIGVVVWKDQAHFWLYILVAAAGSAIGGLVPYGLGRAGGEVFLLKRVDRAKFDKMRARFEKQEFMAVLVPSMLPPPTPWKAFVFAAGVFEMRIVPFMLAVFVGRVIRWLILSLLVLKLGPEAVSVVGTVIHDHLVLFLSGLVLIFAAIGIWAVMRRRRPGEPSV